MRQLGFRGQRGQERAGRGMCMAGPPAPRRAPLLPPPPAASRVPTPCPAVPWGPQVDAAMEASLGPAGLRPRSELDDEDYYPQGGWDTVFLVALLLLGLPANGLMAWLAGSQARQGAGTRLALLLLSLALSDFLFLAAAAFQILEIQHGGHWPLGTAACRFYYFLWGVSYSSGLFLLAALSLDRCLLALCPAWYAGRRPARLPLWVCAGAWVLATLFSAPWLAFPEAAVWWYDLVVCLDFWDSEERPLRMLEVLGGFLPFLLLLVCHALTQAAACKACRCGRAPPPACRGFARVAKAVLSAYVALRLPYQLAQLLYLAFLWDVYAGHLLWEALVYSDYLLLLSSCLSPFLCLLASADLRALLRAVLASFAAALCEERPGSVTPAEPQPHVEEAAGRSPPGARPEASPRAQAWANPAPRPPHSRTARSVGTPAARAQEPPRAWPQQIPNTQAPGTPNTQAPGTPNTQAPGTPNTQAPGTPNTQAPGTPNIQVPGTPNTQAPGTPNTQAEGTPNTQAPGTPNTQAEGTPNTQAEGTPNTQAPGTPNTQAPGTPNTQAEGTPNTQAPGTPNTQAPGTPNTQAPGTPNTQAEETPNTQAEGTPNAQVEGTPNTQAPGTPNTQAPGTPNAQAQGTPNAQKQETPNAQAPGTPNAQAQGTPADQAQVESATQGDAEAQPPNPAACARNAASLGPSAEPSPAAAENPPTPAAPDRAHPGTGPPDEASGAGPT